MMAVKGTWPESRVKRPSINATIDIALSEVNRLRVKMLKARSPRLRKEYEAQWRAARAILASLFGLRAHYRWN
jgi:hypothetical protein